jgi:hypothetical protein
MYVRRCGYKKRVNNRTPKRAQHINLHNVKTNNNITFNGIRQGFSLRDSVYLKDNDYAQADPKLQLFVAEDIEEEEPELRLYYCASCKSKLDYHKHLSIWICSECVVR